MNFGVQLHGCSVDLRKHDVAFLITLRPTVPIHHKYNFREPFIPQVGLTYVRGCEVEGMLDMEGKVIEDGKEYKEILDMLWSCLYFIITIFIMSWNKYRY